MEVLVFEDPCLAPEICQKFFEVQSQLRHVLSGTTMESEEESAKRGRRLW